MAPFCGRKVNAELGPVTELARDRDPTAMLADDSVGDRQAQARPLADVLRSEERLEHARQVLRGDPAPFVADADAEVVGLRPPVIGRRLCSRPVDRELHAPSSVHCLDRVHDEVRDRLFDLAGVGLCVSRSEAFHAEGDVAFLGEGLQELHRALRDHRDVAAGLLDLARAREGEELADDSGHSLGRANDDARVAH